MDEFDNESRNEAEAYVKQEIARDWSYEELQRSYKNLKKVTLKNLPNLWMGLEFALSVKSVLNIKGNTLPFIGPRSDEDKVQNKELSLERNAGLSLDNNQNMECNTDMRGGEISLCAPNEEMKGSAKDNNIDGPYSCPYCDSRLAPDDLYRGHVKSHKGSTPYAGSADSEQYTNEQDCIRAQKSEGLT